MQQTLEESAGIYRTGESLRSGADRLRDLRQRFAAVAIDDDSQTFNTERIAALELSFMLDVAEAIVNAALRREESRGAHTRLDFPKTDSGGYWETVNSCARYADGQVDMGVVPKPEMPADLKAIVAAGS